jgi:acyl-CoA thioester hydrolase/1,4-dihydroxy-2-naphthoyl-CoA hydrolase
MDKKLFRYSSRLYFSEADPAGIMFYSRAMELSHKAWEEFIAEKIGWNTWFSNPEYAFPIIESQCKYQSPCFAGSEIKIELVLVNLGNSSVTIEFTGIQKEKECFKQTLSFVCVDKKSFQKASLPEEVKQNLFK